MNHRSNALTISNSNFGAPQDHVATAPSGVAVGDLLVAIIGERHGQDGETRVITGIPTGWTLIQSFGGGQISSDPRISVLWKYAGASEPSTYTFTFDEGCNVTMCLLAYTGGSNQQPVAVASNSGGANCDAPSVTTTKPGNLFICSVSVNPVSSSTPGAPGGMTTRQDYGTPTGIPLHVADAIKDPAGATGVQSFGTNANGYNAVTQAFFALESGLLMISD